MRMWERSLDGLAGEAAFPPVARSRSPVPQAELA
jgi:hypothetical protein